MCTDRVGVTYEVASQLLLLVHLTVVLVDTRTVTVGITTEGDIKVPQESVATSDQGLGGIGMCVNRRLAVKDNDTVGEIGGHDEIVLDNEGGLLGVHDETLDNSGSHDTLFRVKVSARLVDHVDIGRHSESKDNSNTLQFTTRQVLNFLVDEIIDLEGLVDIGLELRRKESSLDTLEEELTHGTLELGCNLLRLHADVHAGHGDVAVRLLCTSEHSTESSLAGSIFTHHDNDFGVSE